MKLFWKWGEGKKGREEIIHLPLYATSLCLLDVGSATGYLTHHKSLWRQRTDWSGQKGEERGWGKKTELSKCLRWTGCRSFWLLTGLCVEATIHCKDQARWTRSFRFFSRFLSLFLCNVTRGVKYEASTRLRERFYKETKRMMQHGIGGGTATETASRMNSIQMTHSSWHQNSVRKQSRPIVKKRDLYKGYAKDICVCWSCCETPNGEKLPLQMQTNISLKTNSICCIDGKGAQAFRANLALSNIMEIPLLTCSLTSILHIINTEPMEERTKIRNRTLSELDLAV